MKKDDSGEMTATLSTGAPDVSDLRLLRTPEAMVVCAARLWRQARTGDETALNLFRAAFDSAGCSGGCGPYASLLHVIEAAACRTLDIAPLKDARVRDDEKRLLHVLACQQSERPLEAFDALSVFLPGTGVRLGLAYAQSLAASLRKAGLVLPQRKWKVCDLLHPHRLRLPGSSAACVRYAIH